MREDRTRKKQSVEIPYLRIEASGNQLTVSSNKASATFTCTIYEEGVLFLKTTFFRRLLPTFKGQKFLAFQVTQEGLHFGNVLLPFEGSDMVLFHNPSDAPYSWPPPPPKAEQIPKRKPPTLFDMD